MNPALLTLAQQLRKQPLCEHVLVFGSSVTRPDEAADLDIGVVGTLNVMARKDMQNFQHRLLVSARENYGLLDPFVLVAPGPVKLWGRNDEASGWMRAKQAKAIAKDILSGEPFLAWFERVVQPRLAIEPSEPMVLRRRIGPG